MQRSKTGGKSPLRLFLKGNGDLANALLSISEGGQVLARGLRDLVRDKYHGAFSVEILHEPCSRSDLLLQQLRLMPHGCSRWPVDHNLGLLADGATRLFDQPVDVAVFSLQPEITHSLRQHQQGGCLLDPPSRSQTDWTPRQQQDSLEHCAPTGLLEAEEFKANFLRLIRAVKQRLEAHVIVFNCSSLDPDDLTHNYYGLQDTVSVRVHKFNLALMELSVLEGISIIDVDRLLAELGAGEHVLEALRYSPRACEAIRDEFVRVMEDIGFFERRPLVLQIGRGRE